MKLEYEWIRKFGTEEFNIYDSEYEDDIVRWYIEKLNGGDFRSLNTLALRYNVEVTPTPSGLLQVCITER